MLDNEQFEYIRFESTSDFKDILSYAITYDNTELVEKIIKMPITHYQGAFCSAGETGNTDMIIKLVEYFEEYVEPGRNQEERVQEEKLYRED